MKKMITLFAVLLISCSLSASHVHLSLTGVTSGTHFYYCSTTVDTVIVHKPAGAGPHDWYHPGWGYSSVDSVIVTDVLQGYWYFDDGTMIQFYVNFVSIAPTQPWTATDTSKCTESSIILKGQATNQPDFVYAWNTGSTASQINVTTPNTYYVTVTGACGMVNDQINVLNYSIPTPNLGPDVVTCDGNIVTLDPGIFAGYAWSTSVSTPTINVTTPGSYRVTVTDAHGCKGRDTIEITFIYPPSINICLVEFDTITFKNRISWAVPPVNSASLNIYSEISTNVFSLIGTVPSIQTHYIDMTSSPQNQSNSYKISITDTCGNEGVQSAYHKTITLLSAYDQPTNTYGFTWSAYEGLTVPNYLIFGIMNSGTVAQIGSVPGNTFFYNYTNPSPIFVKYFVGFYTPNCASKTNYLVRSNYVNSLITGIDENQDELFNIFPNPAHDRLYMQTPETIFETEIINIFGQVLIHDRDKTEIDISTLPSGTYILRLTGKAYSGQRSFIVY